MNVMNERLLPRRSARRPVGRELTTPVRNSAVIRADLEQLATARDAAVIRIAELEAQRPAVLLSDDDAAAEQHDTEIARQRRAIERADLRCPDLQRELAEAEAREEAERVAAQQAEATAAVDAVLGEVEEE